MQDNPVEVLARVVAGTGPWHVKCFGWGYARHWYTALPESRRRPGATPEDLTDPGAPQRSTGFEDTDEFRLAIYVPKGSLLRLTKGQFELARGRASILFRKGFLDPGPFEMASSGILATESARLADSSAATLQKLAARQQVLASLQASGSA